MKESEIVEIVDNLTEIEIQSLYTEYITFIVKLNNHYHLVDGGKEGCNYYPVLDVSSWYYMDGVSKHKTMEFDRFISGDPYKGTHDLTGKYYYYRLFKLYR